MADERYNGWRNYETWLVKLWMDNEQGDYDFWQEQTSEIIDDEFPIASLSKRLDAWIEEIRETIFDDDAPAGFMSDLLTAAIGAIDTSEIARHLIDDHSEE